jgi:hypothetical protein
MGEQHRPRFLHRAWGFDLERLFAQVNRIRAALPEEIRGATRLLEERKRILESAEAERDRLLEEAREHVARLVASDEVVRRASERSEQTLQQATQEAAALQRGAEEYALRALANLEEYVTRVLTAVRTARERLGVPPEEQTKQ